MNRRINRWLTLVLLPLFVTGSLAACQRAGEDTGAAGSSGRSSMGSSQSGGGTAPDSRSGSSSGTSSESSRGAVTGTEPGSPAGPSESPSK
jgi:hypothetical protein